MGRKFIIFILVLLPFLSQLAALPFVNRMTPVVLGLPFLHFWLFLWILLTPLCTFVIYRLQKSTGGLE
ncbi:DUF3311 domain-containing protein [Aneurinibacillus tyrosinisolvens]|jgi:hypothetical protein|uniref:DUF3311 domain-containing protein n=1 Tax=Aneurinibacillus tyrosinisolvens TaxID=1443435 RepID=UPI00063F89A1|nr:DUF3311 domain-containing protein [Aneurinibacillus tyrosinisolvens]